MAMKALFGLLERPFKNGTVLKGQYKIASFLGKGSYGIAYEAYNLRENEEVVIKQLRRRKGFNASLNAFKREAAMLQKLNHPSIPKFIDYFQEGKHYMLVMEHIKGKNFEDLIFHEGQVYDEKTSFSILLNVLEIVNYFHKQGVVHRDLRIPNIMMKNGRIYIIDFGLARFINDRKQCDMKKMTEEKKLFRDISFKSDFYALGHFVLFLLYSSYEPLSTSENSWENELKLGKQTKSIIRRMLQIDEPYETAEELIREVQDCLFLLT